MGDDRCPACNGQGGILYEPGLLTSVCDRCKGTGKRVETAVAAAAERPRKTHTELRRLLEKCPKAGTFWRHYKGTVYEVVGRAIDESTAKPYVQYREYADQYGDVVFSRPLCEWTEQVLVEGGTGKQRYAQVYPIAWGWSPQRV